MEFRILTSIAELRRQADAWDALWQRSAVTAPVARAELIAQWVEHFAPEQTFRAVTVWNNSQCVAALPLVSGRKAKLMPVGMLPGNAWCGCGTLLWDEDGGGRRALCKLVEGLRSLPWPLLWMYGVAYAEPQWRALADAANESGQLVDVSPDFEVGLVDLNHEWSQIEAAWSGNHRRHMRKAARRAESEGGVELKIIRDFRSLTEVEELVTRGFAVEAEGWKGRGAGDAVANSPAIQDYFIRQAQQAAEWGQLQLVFLSHQGRDIAFEYGWLSKGTFHTPKVGYDEAFSQLSPGQLLRYLSYQQYVTAGDIERIDFYGPLASATQKWMTKTYPVGRLAITCGSWLGKAFVKGFQTARTAQQVWNRRSQPTVTEPVPEPGFDPVPA